MTCPHKYAGRNPSVVYPVWRSLDETAAWHHDNQTPHAETVAEYLIAPPSKSADWPRAEVDALATWAKEAISLLAEYGFPQTAKHGREALDALKGKMG